MDLQDREIGKEEDAAGSGGMKIVVKIRHPKAESPAAEIRAHQCKECNKSFSSGKALGGHMSSAHVQANKDYSYKKQLKSKKGQNRNSGSGSGLHGCVVCLKTFPSEKSLFGHMRCHPGREWRGVVPPWALQQQRNEDDDEPGLGYYSGIEDEEEDTLKDWAVKAKRGRSARSQGTSSDEEELSAGHQLLRLLKRLPDSEVNIIKKRKVDDCYDPDHVEKTAVVLGTTEQRASNSRPLKVKIWNTADDDVEKSDNNIGKGESESEADLLLGAICVLANGKRDLTDTCLGTPERLSPVLKSDHASSSPEKHICSICNKVFPSHQALGGHKSSHNKFKMYVVNTEDDIAPKINNNSNNSIIQPKLKGEIIGLSSNSRTGGVKNVKSDQQTQVGDSPHVCPICERVFATVRALGGHRKIHSNNNNSKERVGSVRDFDLNMVPHDDENGAGDGGLVMIR